MKDDDHVVVGGRGAAQRAAKKAARKAKAAAGGAAGSNAVKGRAAPPLAGAGGGRTAAAAALKKARKARKTATVQAKKTTPAAAAAASEQQGAAEPARAEHGAAAVLEERKAERKAERKRKRAGISSRMEAAVQAAAGGGGSGAARPPAKRQRQQQRVEAPRVAAPAASAALCSSLYYDGCDDEITAEAACELAESGVIDEETLVWSEHPAFDFAGYTAWGECCYVFGSGEPPEPDAPAEAASEEASPPARKKAKTAAPEEAAGADVDADEPQSLKGPPASVTKYPFPVEDADHCETPAQAYADVAPILRSLARQLGKTPAELKIYDPYFCQGRVKENLAAVGFANVYNECEDFYARLKARDLPEHDVVLTNPPYSQDHLQKIVNYITSSGKPWLLLVPNYVYVKEYYRSATRRVANVPSRAAPPFYVSPLERYYYYSPKGVGVKDANGNVRKAGEIKTSPFLSFWYLGGFGIEGTEAAVKDWRTETEAEAAANSVQHEPRRCKIAQSMAALPQAVMDRHDPNRKRLNKTEREQQRKKVSKSGVPLCKQCGQQWGNCRHTKDKQQPMKQPA